VHAHGDSLVQKKARHQSVAGFFAFYREAAMTQVTQPSKAKVREWLDQRTHSHEPPPTSEEIREQLGWNLIPENRRPPQPTD
jgi:hypothetical protein